MKKSYFYGVMISFIFLMSIPKEWVYADESELSFKPTIIQSKDKLDNSTVDFKLKANPGKKLLVEVDVKNTSNTRLDMEASVQDSATNNQGIINYASKKEGLDKVLSLKTLADYKEKFQLEPNKVKRLAVEIEVPKKAFKGIMLGGLMIKQLPKKSSKEMIRNSFSYVIPIMMMENETTLTAAPEIVSVIPDLSTEKHVLKVTVANPVPNIVPGIKYSVDVKKYNSDTVLQSEGLPDIALAPNNEFTHSLVLKKAIDKPGKYKATIKMQSRFGNWEWSKPFEIKSSKSKTIIKDKHTSKNNSIISLSVGIVISLVLCLVSYFSFKLTKKETSSK